MTSARWRRGASDLLAGGITAIVFYPEYIGLAAVLAAVLPGAQATAMAGMLVIGSVVVCCTLAVLSRQMMLTGPRAASFAVMVGGVKLATSQAAVDARLPVALLAMSLMLMVAAAMQLIGLNEKVCAHVRGSHVALRKGFMYASAVGIVTAVCAGQLEGCLRIDAAATLAVLVASVGGALAWSNFCATRGMQRPLLRKLGALATLIGMAVSVVGYQLFIAPAAHGGLCATLGTSGLRMASIAQLLAAPELVALAWAGLPLWVWALVVLGGALLGIAMLLENLTALKDCESRLGIESRHWAACFKTNAAANLLLGAPLGLACGSLSTSRSLALHDAGGRTPLAALGHGLALVAILLVFSGWIGRLPQLSVVVALVLVAVQMVDGELRDKVWRPAYQPGARAGDVRTAWLFWAVLGTAVAAGLITRSQGWGFSLGVLLGVLASAAMLSFLQRERERAPS